MVKKILLVFSLIVFLNDAHSGFVKHIVHDVGDVAKDIGHDVVHIAKDIGHGVDKVAKDVEHGVVCVAKKVEHGVVDAAKDVGHVVVKVAKDVEHVAEDVGKDVLHGVEDGAKEVYKGAEEVGKGIYETGKYVAEGAYNFTKDTIIGMGKGIDAIAHGHVKEAFKDVGSGFYKGIKTSETDMRGLYKGIEGISEGINDVFSGIGRISIALSPIGINLDTINSFADVFLSKEYYKYFTEINYITQNVGSKIAGAVIMAVIPGLDTEAVGAVAADAVEVSAEIAEASAEIGAEASAEIGAEAEGETAEGEFEAADKEIPKEKEPSLARKVYEKAKEVYGIYNKANKASGFVTEAYDDAKNYNANNEK